MVTNKPANGDFPSASATLERFGLKFTPGGPHISRTMMLTELGAVLANVPLGSSVADYRAAILVRNVLGKATDSTRVESLRRLAAIFHVTRELGPMGAHVVQRLTQSTPRHHGVQVRQQQCLDVAKHGLAVLLAVPSLTPDCYNPRNQSAGGIILSARISSHSR